MAGVVGISTRAGPDPGRRLGVLRFPLILGVMYLHAYRPGGVGAASNSWLAGVDFFLSDLLVMLARPLFFLISGYFFFANGAASWPVVLRKWKSRGRSLLAPYLLWNALILGLWVLASCLPATAGLLPPSGKPVTAFSGRDLADAFLGFSGYPIAYQLWFVRDLILLVLLAPLWGFSPAGVRCVFLLGLGVAWLSDRWAPGIPGAEGAVFFFAGAFLAGTSDSFARIDRHAVSAALLYALLAGAAVFIPDGRVSTALLSAALLPGALVVLHLAGRIAAQESWRTRFERPAGQVFFLFLAHEPLLTVLKKAAYASLDGASPGVLLVARIAVTALAAGICLAVHRMLEARFPRVLRLMTGGR